MAMNNDTPLDEATKAMIADRLLRTGRSCGDCSMCCKLLPIIEMNKPANTWCQHCRPGKGGCSIYHERPPVCSGFVCQWLVDLSLGDEWYPKNSKIVVRAITHDGRSAHLHFTVDPTVGDRWKSKPYYDAIRSAAINGLNGLGNQHFSTHVIYSEKTDWLILPNKEVDVTNKDFVVLKTGPSVNDWEAAVFDSPEKVRHFAEHLKEGERIAREANERQRLQIILDLEAVNSNSKSKPAAGGTCGGQS